MTATIIQFRPVGTDGFCSFCLKTKEQVKLLVGRDEVAICVDCVGRCTALLALEPATPKDAA